MIEGETRQGEVLIVGSINVDLVVRAPLLPMRGETVTGGVFSQHHGGKGANQAVAAARLGARVTFIGAVGGDDMGRSAIESIAREEIDPGRIATLGDVPTGVALIVVDAHGENQIAVAPGANGRVHADLVDSALAGYRPASGGVYLASLEVPDDAVIAGARRARELGMIILINPAPPRGLPGELMGLRPILCPNEHEAEALTGESDPMQAARLLCSRTGAPVIVTVGSRGALVVTSEGYERLAAPTVQAEDTTGAGDTFAGALAAELAVGAGLIPAARLAVRAASLSVTARGARTGMPTRSMLAAG